MRTRGVRKGFAQRNVQLTAGCLEVVQCGQALLSQRIGEVMEAEAFARL